LVLEEQILLYYLRIFSLLIFFLFIFTSYFLFFKEIKLKNNSFNIEKNETIKTIVDTNFKNLNFFEIFFAEFFLTIHSKYIKNIHYGKFIIPEKNNFIKIISIITKPSNFILKITIVDGWDKVKLNKLLMSFFEEKIIFLFFKIFYFINIFFFNIFLIFIIFQRN